VLGQILAGQPRVPIPVTYLIPLGRRKRQRTAAFQDASRVQCAPPSSFRASAVTNSLRSPSFLAAGSEITDRDIGDQDFWFVLWRRCVEIRANGSRVNIGATRELRFTAAWKQAIDCATDGVPSILAAQHLVGLLGRVRVESFARTAA